MLGKGLAGLFWLVLAAAVAKWLGSPFEQLIYALAAVLLVVHALEVVLFAGLLRGRTNPWGDRLQIMLFGAFHLVTLKVAPVADESVRIATEEAIHA